LEEIMRKLLTRLVRDESGGEVIDYVLVVALFVIVSLVVMGSVGSQVHIRWQRVLDAL
jgi:Flp pilus assembly pilin Flp